MTQVTTGLPNGGATTYYQFSYDDSLSTADGRDRTIALMAVADADFGIMNGWFGGIGVGMTLPMPCQVIADPGSWASWYGSGGTAHITLAPGPGGSGYLCRWLLCAEVTEMFMAHQGLGWFGTSNEGSTGEGLSHFLANQLMLSIGSPSFYSMPASIWLNTNPRPDWVNNTDPTDYHSNEKSACALLFLWYLYTQLGFSVSSIVAAAGANLGVVYRNLTGDTNDPFPYFKSLLDMAYPNPTGNFIPGPNIDNPFPLGTLTWLVTKGTYGHDEVSTSLASATPGRFPNAVALALDGFNGQVLGSNTPATSVSPPGFAGLTFPPNGAPQFMSSNHLIPQRITFPCDALFTSSSLPAFPTSGSETRGLDGTITIAGRPFPAHTVLTFDAAGDPFFTNVNAATGNAFWLSQDLRVFTATPGLNNHPVAGAPPFSTDSYDGAYSYIRALLGWLNSNYSDPSGTDPFDPATSVLPGQSAAYTADSSVTPTTTSGGNTYNNYNFAIARVRLNGLAGAPAQTDNVRVFFRVWGTQTADTDYQPTTTYLSHTDAAGLPDYPLLPAGAHTIPFFATGNSPNLSDANNPEYGASGVNNKSLIIPAGATSMWAYYGCFINVYDPDNKPDGSTAVQGLLPGDHHCIVAQIAYDGDPIVNSGGTTQSPESSDKLAQRNLQVTHSGNPGWPATHRVPQTFDLRRSPKVPDRPDLLGYPDELVIDWGNAPKGTSAQIFWPGAKAADVIEVASRLYGVHQLTVVDAETIGCEVDGRLTYIPIPTDAPQDLAGLLTLDMPAGVKYGQEYNVVVRRIATRRLDKESRRPAVAAKRTSAMAQKKKTGKHAVVPADQPHVTVAVEEQGPATEPQTESLTWRYITGSFQVKVPVTDEREMLGAEEDALAIFRWRLAAMPSSNRWHRVLKRYVDYRAEKVDALGGDAAKIPPSLHGRPRWTPGKRRDDDVEVTGKVSSVHYDSFGDFTGFTLRTDDAGERRFHSRERAVENLVRTAWADRMRISVIADRDEPERPEAIFLRRV